MLGKRSTTEIHTQPKKPFEVWFCYVKKKTVTWLPQISREYGDREVTQGMCSRSSITADKNAYTQAGEHMLNWMDFMPKFSAILLFYWEELERSAAQKKGGQLCSGKMEWHSSSSSHSGTNNLEGERMAVVAALCRAALGGWAKGTLVGSLWQAVSQPLPYSCTTTLPAISVKWELWPCEKHGSFICTISHENEGLSCCWRLCSI